MGKESMSCYIEKYFREVMYTQTVTNERIHTRGGGEGGRNICGNEYPTTMLCCFSTKLFAVNNPRLDSKCVKTMNPPRMMMSF